MDLRTFLDANSLTPEDFGARVGHSVHAVNKWLRGERIPRQKAMGDIETATDGAVRPNDWYPAQRAKGTPR